MPPEGGCSMKKGLRVFLILLCLVFAGVFGYSAYRLYDIIHTYRVSEKMYNQLSGQYVSTEPAEPIASDTATDSASAEAAVQIERSPIQVNFNMLQEQNKQVIGWIYGPDTVINYPVAQGTDNDYYLYNFIDGTYTGTGTPFLDYLCAGDFSGKNSVVYGHHMNDGSMFAALTDYRKEGYYEEHPVLYLNTPTQNYRIDVFAGYVTDSDSPSYTFHFYSDEAFLQFVQDAKLQSNFKTEVEVSAEDRVITLSTCSYEYYDARYVIQGKLVPVA